MDQQTPFHLPVGPCVRLVETGNLMNGEAPLTTMPKTTIVVLSFVSLWSGWPNCLFSGVSLRALTSVSLPVSHLFFAYYCHFLELFAKKMKEFTGFNVDVM